MRILTTLSFIFGASFASAQTSDMIAESGLAGAESTLAALPYKTPSDQFALGAVRFLRGIEKSLQFRWQHNMKLDGIDLPVLRLNVPPNANAAPFTPDLITAIFQELRLDMDASRAALDAVTSDAALELDLTDLWFDINMNGTRDAGENMVEFAAGILLPARARSDTMSNMPTELVIRFDTADVAWLTAYTHLLSGISELVIAFDPTEAITKVLTANQTMMDMRGNIPPANMFDAQFGGWVDKFAMVYGALNQQPVAENTRAAHGHFMEMIAENKVFWAGVNAETDNDREWIPNKNQTAALGFTLPADASLAWQSLLNEAERLLNGDLLIPYWRVAPVGGVNLKKLFMDPPVVDIVDWVQGAGLVAYLEVGPVVEPTNLRRFERMVSGDTLLYSLLFN